MNSMNKKNSTIYEIAKLANVSVATVNRAFRADASIKPQTRELILKLAEEHQYKPSIAAARLSKRTIRIGILMADCVHVFSEELKAGFIAAYDELRAYKVEYDIMRFDAQKCSQDDYLRLLEECVEKEYDGILLVPFSFTPPILEAFNKMHNSGTELAVVTQEIPSFPALFSATYHILEAGRMAAEMLHLCVKGPDVVVFTGHMENNIHKTLVRGFQTEAREYDLNIMQIINTKEDPEYARLQAISMLKADKLPDGIYISSANSVSIIEEVLRRNLEGRISIVASDTFPEMIRYIEQGVVSATIFQNPYKQAKMAFENMFYHIAEGRAVPKVLMVTPQIVIKSNVNLFKDQEKMSV